MSTLGRDVVERVSQPEYTGSNRCLPCTVVNVAVALALSAVVTVLTSPLAGTAALALALAAIYLRGYLVPGTPELTKRYLPDRVRRWFGKAPDLPEPGETVDVEAYLLDAGVLADPPEGDDLELVDSVATEWHELIESVRGEPAAAAGDVLDLADPGVEVRDGATVVTDGGLAVADWPSRAALLADLAAVGVLADRDPEWGTRDREEQGRILAGLRLFVERCPDCGATPELGEGTVESCCRRAQVYTYACPDCDARLMEIEQ
ncbi:MULTISPECIES: hypothetical protein [Halolamina]|uniref:Uncharacterized protein n=1 Tax=Halolamina pelagica TaxID=699431 RepID=A0A1I5NLZ3_9EURY|nr:MULTISPECIES: hypothetical protein [Halolamina]NHX36386.1 hypothetical protein [Halolamina sp. R1-12]SFP22858.1 hypothetical protein SAMN05216277_102101 [Halolamina pelagica]